MQLQAVAAGAGTGLTSVTVAPVTLGTHFATRRAEAARRGRTTSA